MSELARLSELWGKLSSETANLQPFQSLDWLIAQANHKIDGMRFRAILVHDGDELVGILPMALYAESTRIGRVRVLGYPLDGWGTCFGPLGSDALTTMSAALQYVAGSRREWDVLDLRWVPAESRSTMALAFQHAGLKVWSAPWGERSLIDFSGTWDAYWTSRSSKLRNNIRRCEKKLAKLGRVTCHHVRPGMDQGSSANEAGPRTCVRANARDMTTHSGCSRNLTQDDQSWNDKSDDPRWDVFEMCDQVAGTSWQGSSTTGNTISDAEVREQIREVHATAALRGNVSMHVLCVADEPIAFVYNYVVCGRVFGLRTGYDPRFANAGPGSVLMARTIRDAFERRDVLLDLGETPSIYKTLWRTSHESTYRFCHYPFASVRAQCLRLKRSLFARDRGVGAGKR